ncbi:hypothetical protein ABMA28_010193 [Loxostege sticticalis]|uniref:Glutathione peroxidase n=1 Tax=Loxostege sticticalis TaxID=481309 RepID=A0ABD0SA01_LOXSC
MAKKANHQEKKPLPKKPPSSSFPIGKLFLVTAVLAGLASFYVYKVLTTPPDLPELDLNQWWGPYPIDQQKDVSIRPFKIEFSDVVINDLRERLLHRRPFVPPLEDAGFTYGFNSNFLTRVLDYWQNSYKFKDREAFLNQYNHYVTKIQGLDVHFMHVKPKVSPDVMVVPLLLLHGWPGSVREFYELVPKLTAPRDDVAFVFELVAPSLPGAGFSQGAARPGFGPIQIAGIMHQLMQRLGHTKYYVQGGDAGHTVGSLLATYYPQNVLGFHTNFPTLTFSSRASLYVFLDSSLSIQLMQHLDHTKYCVQGGDAGHTVGSLLATYYPQNVLGFHTNFPTLTFSSRASLYVFLGSFWPSLVVEPELESRLYPLGKHVSHLLEESGYMHIQATKPDTIGTALTDSPAGLAAYILEKFSTWTNPEFRKAGDGKLLDKFQLTHLLDNVMIYWVSNSITTSMRLYAETMNKKMLAVRIDDIPTDVPTWGIKFKHELLFHPDCVLRLKYKNYVASSVVEDGGHFAAMEMPDLMAEDIFKAVATFREFHEANTPASSAQTVYDFTVKDLNGREVKLDQYRGHVLLIVNVASQCGLTDTNYKQLNQLYEKYESKGLRILAFPCNQFGGQEPGSPEDIFKFTKNRNVKFDLFEKIEVNGDEAHPLWKFLKTIQRGTMGDFIKWNFSKFIVNKHGIPVARFGPNTDPVDLEPYLEKEL